MSKQTLVEKINSLPSERIAEVEDFVDFLRQREARQQQKQSLEDQLEQRLFELGIISEIKPPIDPASHQDFEPIENKGKPLSEVIIEERR